MYWISTCIASSHSWEGSDASVTSSRNWPFLQDLVPPLLVQIQAPPDNHSESMLASIHVSLPAHNSLQLMNTERVSHGSTWKNCCVFLHNTCGQISTGQHETWTPISSPKSLRPQANFHFVHEQRNDLVKLADGRHQSSTSCVSSWYQVHSSFQQSKCVFLVANVITLLHVGQDHSTPILSANPSTIQG